jgi:3-deoxy-D-manno-oct-2-ulosonic acid (Kdo) hydroxylase
MPAIQPTPEAKSFAPSLLDAHGFASADEVMETLEAGGVVTLKGAAFQVSSEELELMDPAISKERSKNVSFDATTGEVRGANVEGERLSRVAAMMARYAAWADDLARDLLPGYADSLQIGRTSFRPRPIGTAALSPRKDDRRLHVDAFPSQPVQGRRILRVFTNVDPGGQARTWTLGEDFETYARRFLPHMRGETPGRWLAERLGLTRGRRTAYDRLMLELHDRSKLDETFQTSAPRRRVDFAAGDTWLVFTDAAPHAALAGRNAFEQTFFLPVAAMRNPAASPLRTLERLTGRTLV